MDGDVAAGERVPASGIQRAEPGIGKSHRRFQLGPRRHLGEQGVTSFLVLFDDGGGDVQAGLDCGSATLALGDFPVVEIRARQRPNEAK